MIQKLKLNNFTVFKELEIDFSSKINIIIGENGTGKSHLLKAAYALCSANTIDEKFHETENDLIPAITDQLVRVFMPPDNKLGKMRRNGVKEDAKMKAEFVFDKKIDIKFSSRHKEIDIISSSNYERYSWNPIFIPTKEILSFLKGFGSEDLDKEVLQVMFDQTYFDLAASLLSQGNEENDKARAYNVAEDIVNGIKGCFTLKDTDMLFQPGKYQKYKDPKDIREKGQERYFKPKSGELYSTHMMAEGFRKFGIIQTLLQNGSLIPGVTGTLFWDEPESNMNPQLMKLIVEALLELSRKGQQIVLATHDYVLLKWFDLLMKEEDHVRFHSLYRDEDSSEVKITSTDEYALISKNAIAETFTELYNVDIDKSFGDI